MKTRQMRYVSVLLGLALLFIVGGIVLVMMLNGGRPTATTGAHLSPSPSSTAPLTAAATDATFAPGSASPTVDAGSTDQPTDAPTGPASPEPTSDIPPEGSPSPDPSPTPTPTPVAPMREITFAGVGLDNPNSPEEEQVSPRLLSFNAEGPGVIRLNLSRVSARVRACIGRGDPQAVTELVCRTMRRGEMEREVPAGVHRWTVSLIGAEATGSPTATVRLAFTTNDAGISLQGFRFQGEAIDNYNGFVAEIRAATGGPISITAELDDGEGGAHPYRLVIQEIAGGPAQPFIAESEGRTLAETTELTAERSYQVRLENRESVSDLLILLRAELDWP